MCVHIKTFGSGVHLIKFYFFDRLPNALPSDPVDKKFGLVSISFKTNSRSGIAAVLKKYHAAEIACRHDYYSNTPHERYPKYGYRYIAERMPRVVVFSFTKDDLPLIFSRHFCFHVKGFVKPYRLPYITARYNIGRFLP